MDPRKQDVVARLRKVEEALRSLRLRETSIPGGVVNGARASIAPGTSIPSPSGGLTGVANVAPIPGSELNIEVTGSVELPVMYSAYFQYHESSITTNTFLVMLDGAYIVVSSAVGGGASQFGVPPSDDVVVYTAGYSEPSTSLGSLAPAVALAMRTVTPGSTGGGHLRQAEPIQVMVPPGNHVLSLGLSTSSTTMICVGASFAAT